MWTRIDMLLLLSMKTIPDEIFDGVSPPSLQTMKIEKGNKILES